MGKEILHIRRKRLFSILFGLPLLLFALLYGGGYLAQFIRNYRGRHTRRRDITENAVLFFGRLL